MIITDNDIITALSSDDEIITKTVEMINRHTKEFYLHKKDTYKESSHCDVCRFTLYEIEPYKYAENHRDNYSNCKINQSCRAEKKIAKLRKKSKLDKKTYIHTTKPGRQLAFFVEKQRYEDTWELGKVVPFNDVLHTIVNDINEDFAFLQKITSSKP